MMSLSCVVVEVTMLGCLQIKVNIKRYQNIDIINIHSILKQLKTGIFLPYSNFF